MGDGERSRDTDANAQDTTAPELRRTREQLDAVEQRYRALVDTLNVGIIVVDLDGAVQTANRNALRILNLPADFVPSSSAFATALEVLDDSGQVLAPKAFPLMTVLRTGRQVSNVVLGVRRPGSSVTWILFSTRLLTDAERSRSSVLCTFIDITAQREAQEELRASERRFRLLAENAADMIYRFRLGPDPHFEYVSPAIASVLGYSPDDWYDDPQLPFQIVHPDDRARIAERYELAEPAEEPLVLRMTRRDGTLIWTEHRLVPVRDPSGKIVAVEGIARDVTALKALEADLSHRALHDAMTGLPNRVLLLDRLERALARIRRHPGKLAVLYLDLDRFKAVNDNLGHDAGDRLLVAVARRLEQTLRPSDSVARLGGDEFAAVLPDLGRPDEAFLVAGRILDAVAQPVDVGGSELLATVSIGVAFADDDSTTAAEMLRRADVAMYAAKDRGRARVASYDPDLGRK